MSPLRITSSDGTEIIVTLAQLDHQLADETRFTAVLDDLIRIGEARIELKGGQRATVVCVDDERRAAKQAVLPLPRASGFAPSVMREYDVMAQLRFELPAHIRCSARSDQEANLVVEEVLTGVRPPPAGFEVEISQDDQEAFISGLAIASDGLPQGFGVKHVTVTGVSERILLEGHASP